MLWEDARYRPITPVRGPPLPCVLKKPHGVHVAGAVQGRPSGVLIVTDTTPEEPVELAKVKAPSMNSSAADTPTPTARPAARPAAPPSFLPPCSAAATVWHGDPRGHPDLWLGCKIKMNCKCTRR